MIKSHIFYLLNQGLFFILLSFVAITNKRKSNFFCFMSLHFRLYNLSLAICLKLKRVMYLFIFKMFIYASIHTISLFITASRIRIDTHRLEDERSTINLWPCCFYYYLSTYFYFLSFSLKRIQNIKRKGCYPAICH